MGVFFTVRLLEMTSFQLALHERCCTSDAFQSKRHPYTSSQPVCAKNIMPLVIVIPTSLFMFIMEFVGTGMSSYKKEQEKEKEGLLTWIAQ
jgi:hypothetical protein